MYRSARYDNVVNRPSSFTTVFTIVVGEPPMNVTPGTWYTLRPSTTSWPIDPNIRDRKLLTLSSWERALRIGA
jgi:hypothetical protein